jgi:hypothetical protein
MPAVHGRKNAGLIDIDRLPALYQARDQEPQPRISGSGIRNQPPEAGFAQLAPSENAFIEKAAAFLEASHAFLESLCRFRFFLRGEFTRNSLVICGLPAHRFSKNPRMTYWFRSLYSPQPANESGTSTIQSRRQNCGAPAIAPHQAGIAWNVI